MQRVVVERAFEQPVEFADIQAREDAAAWCSRAQRVQFIRSFFSRDRKHMVCLYDAPDAEAVRTLQRSAELPVEHLYPVHPVLDTTPLPERPRGYSLAVAQRDMSELPGLSLEVVTHVASDPMGCNQRMRLTHFGGYVAHDMQRMVCVYYAPDLEAVRKANREIGVPWEHLWAGELIPANK